MGLAAGEEGVLHAARHLSAAPVSLVPSRLARLFAGLPVESEETTLAEDVQIPPPRPEEAAQVARAVRHRRFEYAAGRHCARQALGRLGIPDAPLLNGEDRAPRWPAGVVGAITHTSSPSDGYCGVVVARAEEVYALGLDAEGAEPLEDELWRLILTGAEREALGEAPATARGRLAKLIFSAKEAYYKAQYPVTRRFLGFHEVEIRLGPEGAGFEARLLAPLDTTPPRLERCAGRILADDALVLTAVALRAA
jgi:4'-phosphopantetheinyl transferase EntD